MNPFEVGFRGESASVSRRACLCCGEQYLVEAMRGRGDLRIPCPECKDHVDASEDVKTVGHLERMRELYQRSRSLLADAAAEVDRVHRENKRYREQTAAALQSRSRYRRAIRIIQETHQSLQDKCSCGNRGCTVGPDIYEALRNWDKELNGDWLEEIDSPDSR